MSVWGKIAGAAAGFALTGGPIGALIGVLAGHVLIDKEGASEQPLEADALRDWSSDVEASPLRAGTADASVAFAIAAVALCAKMAKADGVVSRDEIDAFRRAFPVPPDQLTEVGHLFNLAKQDVAGFEAYATQIRGMFKARPGVLSDLIDSLFLIARADGYFHPGEEQFLRRVADIFGISEDHFARMREAHFGPDKADPYRVLGVTRDAPITDIKRAYHAAVKENHPDALAGRGVPEEFFKLANEKLAAINAAYERINKDRDEKTGPS